LSWQAKAGNRIWSLRRKHLSLGLKSIKNDSISHELALLLVKICLAFYYLKGPSGIWIWKKYCWKSWHLTLY
jgi:hypothetical protein